MKKSRIQKLRQELRNYSYKVGTVLTIEEEEEAGLCALVMACHVRDSNSRRDKGGAVYWSLLLREEALFHPNGRVKTGVLKSGVMNLAHIIERHEVEEWLRYKGRPVHAAHF